MSTTERPMRADARRNRERILSAARVVFGAQGAEAQMDAVAAHAGVGVGTLYRHFPTKEALMGELIREQFLAFVANAHAALDGDDEPFERFARLLRRNAELMSADTAVQHAMMSMGVEIWERAEPVRTELLALTAELIARAQAAGQLRADFSAGDVPMLMCGLGASMGMSGPGFDWRRHLELLIDATRAR